MHALAFGLLCHNSVDWSRDKEIFLSVKKTFYYKFYFSGQIMFSCGPD